MTKQLKVRKAVIAAAGFGTRFLPQTKALPKEMLPLVDKPIIQYIVEELVEAGIEDIIIVTGYHKRSIEDHFDQMSGDLRANLEQGNKIELLETTKRISDLANFTYIRQKGPYGSATPILNAAPWIGDEPFIYTFADDLIVAQPNRFTQTIDLYNEFPGTILPCIEVTKDEDYVRYGILGGEFVRHDVLKMSNLVEKPGKDKAASNFASIGGYLLTPDIFKYVETGLSKLGKDDEFYLTTYALQPMMAAGLPLYGFQVANGRYYDTGNKLEYLKTVVDFALKHDDVKTEFRDYLRTVVQ
ncbi:MAG: sugar phosphate nucleotidyltransferase [Patescibacteria group bacterium]